MANIFDYLDWRSDVPFSADPFNEVDNLVLSELAYTNFRDIVPDDGTEVPLLDACAAFFSKHTREELLAGKSYTAKAPLLMEGMTGGARFRDITLSHYVDEVDPQQGLQMSAITIALPDGCRFIAFRGTDGTLVGWKEDFNISFLSETAGQKRAVQYLDQVGSSLDGSFIIGGHSKGGNLAIYAASFCRPEIRNRIRAVYSNDGPGFRQDILDSEGYLNIVERSVQIVPDTSVIGQLLSNKSPRRVVKSSASGIVQHDGFTWQVQRNRFEQAAMSSSGEMIGQTLGGWLEQMDDESRASFTETVFSLIESTEKDTFSEISEQKLKSTGAIVNAGLEMPKEKRQELMKILGQLGHSGSKTVSDYVSSFISKIQKSLN